MERLTGILNMLFYRRVAGQLPGLLEPLLPPNSKRCRMILGFWSLGNIIEK